MTFSVTILGSGSAIPTLKRNPSAHLLNVNERLLLIDCAEGTQIQIRKYRIHFQRITHILISHLHGDHYYGLMGLLTSFHLLGRKDELHLYGPPLLQEIIDTQLQASGTTLIYPLHFHSLTSENYELLFENEKVTVHAFPVIHSVPTFGFLFREKRQQRKIRKEVLENVKIPFSIMPKLKRGEDYTDPSGKVYRNAELTTDPPTPRSYAYCTDTLYDEKIIPYIHGCDLLYHEATFMQDKLQDAKDKMHSTAMEAATIAKKAQVRKLIIGHFSARYEDMEPMLLEARSVFPETYVVEDGDSFQI
ncbi:MAG: ribonuclease Z [Bacteroidetes bacterium]|nr:ribonuclease Z [Bacteroidota bacterium]